MMSSLPNFLIFQLAYIDKIRKINFLIFPNLFVIDVQRQKNFYIS